LSRSEPAPVSNQSAQDAPSQSEPVGEPPQASGSDTSEVPQNEEPRESLRGSAAQLASRDKAHAEAVAEAVAAARKEAADEWRRRLAAEIPRQVESEVQKRLEAQQPQERTSFFVDEDAAFNQRSSEVLNPIHQQIDEVRTALLEERLHRIAGGEKAAKIEEEIGKAMQSGDPDIQVLKNAVRTKGPAAASLLVEWFDKRSFDPAAKEAEIEARILAKYGITPGQAPPQQQQTAPLMPSNLAGARNVGTRQGPAWAGPTPLGDIFKR
jgi:hypothetical protein